MITKHAENQPAAVTLTADDIVNPIALAEKLRSDAHPFATHLLSKFSPEGRELLAKVGAQGADSKELAQLLACEIRTVVAGGESLYDEIRVNGAKLRKSTRKLIKRNPDGAQRERMNLLLVQDVFPSELDHDSCELIKVVKKKGVEFRIYKERRKLQTIWNESFRITFPAVDGQTSTHTRSLKEAESEIEGIADAVLAGQARITRKDSKDRDIKAQAYDELAAEVAKLGATDQKGVLEFIKDAVKAQLALGLGRALLTFVITALELLVKPVTPLLLQEAVGSFSEFVMSRKDVSKYCRRRQVAVIRRFAAAIPGVVHARRLKSLPKDSPIPEQPKGIHVGDIRPNDIQTWLNGLKKCWRTTRSDLDYVRAFLVYCRDALHALPPALKTAAHIVPRPKPDYDVEPVPATVLSFVDVWRILSNLQDLESVWFLALAVFAGLHQSEILRLEWHDIIWVDGLPIQVFVPSGKGKDKHGNRLGVHVDIRPPLKSILALGRGRTGRIVSRNYLREDRITPLVHRLNITWDESIMRHTFVSNLFGLGYSFEEVARQARNTVAVLKRHYYAPIPKPEAERFFSLPVPITRFSILPIHLRCWNANQLEEFQMLQDGGYAIVPMKLEEPTAVKGNRVAKPMRRVAWPDDLVLQVMLWEKSQEQIGRELGCRQTTVSSHAIRQGLVSPKSDYLLRLKNGLPVEIPDEVLRAREKLAKRRHSAGSQAAPSNGAPPDVNGEIQGPAAPSNQEPNNAS